jgi:hypothetical protein
MSKDLSKTKLASQPYNPRRLSAKTIGVGYRLLNRNECLKGYAPAKMWDRSHYSYNLEEIEAWEGWVHKWSTSWQGWTSGGGTYRTRLSPRALLRLRKAALAGSSR